MARASEYPEEGELVICTVRNVKNFGAFVILDEYGGKEGFIHIAEVSTGWVKYIRDFIREGQKVVCKVIRINEERNQVDLSLKQVNEHQKREKIRQWKNEQKAEKLIELVAERLGKDVDWCYRSFGDRLIEAEGLLYTAFEKMVMDERAAKQYGLDGDWMPTLLDVIRENITPPFVTIGGVLDVQSFDPDGVDVVRNALLMAESQTSGEIEVVTAYVGAPKYRITVKAPDYKIAEEVLKRATESAIRYVQEKGGVAKFERN